MNEKTSRTWLGKALLAALWAIIFLSLPLQTALAGPPQHIRYETARELNLPPLQKLIVSWIRGNISNNWGYIKLLSSPGMLEDIPLFMISGLDRQILWRVECFDLFDGEGWGQSDLSFISAVLNASLGNYTFTVHIEAPSGNYVGILPLPTSNESLSGLRIEGNLSGYLTNFGSLLVLGNVSGLGLTYQVAYSPPSYNLTELANARREDVPEEILRKYTVLPEDIPPELAELIEELRDENLTIAEQLSVILDRFREFNYNPNLSAVNISGDPLAWFLRNKEGDSSLFATAFILLSRGVGIPSRFVVGFKPRNVSPEGLWIRLSDLYSWAEVYFPNVGWIPVDPVPYTATEDALSPEILANITRFSVRRRVATESNQTTSATNETVGGQAISEGENQTPVQLTNESQSGLKALFESKLFLLLLVTVSLAVPIVQMSRRKKGPEEVEELAEKLPEEKTLRALEDLDEIYGKVMDFYDSERYRDGVIFMSEKFQELSADMLDFPKQDWETFREFLLRFAEDRKLEEEGISELLGFAELVERAKYSGMQISREDFLKCVRSLSKLLDIIRSSLEREALKEAG